jgi:hypothetical protein
VNPKSRSGSSIPYCSQRNINNVRHLAGTLTHPHPHPTPRPTAQKKQASQKWRITAPCQKQPTNQQLLVQSLWIYYREIMEDLRVLMFFPAKIGVPNPPSNWELLLFGVPPIFVKSHILGDIPLNFTI